MPELVTETDSGPARVITLSGDLDPESIPQVRAGLDSVLREAQPKTRLVLDLSGVGYISAGGLKTILHLIREVNRLDGRLVLCGLGGYVAEALEATRISLLVPIRPDLETALREF
jgi:anti-sigma B factor antagonist